jgi:hypothetical protein
MVLEDRAANSAHLPLIDEINLKCSDTLAVDDWVAVISETVPQLTARAIGAIRQIPIYSRPTTTFDGLSGESIIDE